MKDLIIDCFAGGGGASGKRLNGWKSTGMKDMP